MKYLKFVGLLLGVVCVLSVKAADTSLTSIQENAQKSVYQYLDREKFRPEIDSSDNSVCFRQNGILYWITFSSENPILYTFHRKGYRVGEGADEYKRYPAIVAANEINRKNPGMRLSVGDSKVDVEEFIYASTPQDFNSVFRNSFEKFANIDNEFKVAYEKALAQERAQTERITREITDMLPPSALRKSIKNISFRIVDHNGEPVSNYDEPLRTFNVKYIQPRIEFNPWTEAPVVALLYMKITKPDGETIYLPGKKYTSSINVTLDKSKKTTQVEGDYFGTDKKDFWKAGEYKVEILDNFDVIYETTFNLL